MSYESAKGVERELIFQHKSDLDENTKKSRPIILESKCNRCGKIHPNVTFKWYNSHTDGYPSLKIQIPAANNETMKKIFKAEEALSLIGIHFDTGYGGLRDWEFDWSLSGKHLMKNEETGKYEEIDRTRRIDK